MFRTIYFSLIHQANSKQQTTGILSIREVDLLLVLATARIPTAQFETSKQLVKKLKIIQEAKEEFWDRWGKEVFPVLLMLPKSTKYKWSIQIGDMKLRSNKITAGQTHKYTQVKEYMTHIQNVSLQNVSSTKHLTKRLLNKTSP